MLRKNQLLYYFLVFIRFIFIFSFGYIHPDEFFQGPSVLAKDCLDIKSTIPWEFADTTNPLRTIVTPYKFRFIY